MVPPVRWQKKSFRIQFPWQCKIIHPLRYLGLISGVRIDMCPSSDGEIIFFLQGRVAIGKNLSASTEQLCPRLFNRLTKLFVCVCVCVWLVRVHSSSA